MIRTAKEDMDLDADYDFLGDINAGAKFME